MIVVKIGGCADIRRRYSARYRGSVGRPGGGAGV